MAQQESLFPSRDSLEQVQQEALAQLPITNPNELIALLHLQQNTVLNLLNKPEQQYAVTYFFQGDDELRVFYTSARSTEHAGELFHEQLPTKAMVADIQPYGD